MLRVHFHVIWVEFGVVGNGVYVFVSFFACLYNVPPPPPDKALPNQPLGSRYILWTMERPPQRPSKAPKPGSIQVLFTIAFLGSIISSTDKIGVHFS